MVILHIDRPMGGGMILMSPMFMLPITVKYINLSIKHSKIWLVQSKVNLERRDKHFLGCIYSLIEIVSFINHDHPQIFLNAGSANVYIVRYKSSSNYPPIGIVYFTQQYNTYLYDIYLIGYCLLLV